MYLNFVNNQPKGKPQQLPNCYECISNFDCLEKNDPEALKDLKKYGLPDHKWLKIKDISDALDINLFESYNYEDFDFCIKEDLVYIKYKKILLSKEEIIQKIREQRNKILASTDWTQLLDVNLPEYDKLRYLQYRKALRDLPNKYKETLKLEWPVL